MWFLSRVEVVFDQNCTNVFETKCMYAVGKHSSSLLVFISLSISVQSNTYLCNLISFKYYTFDLYATFNKYYY